MERVANIETNMYWQTNKYVQKRHNKQYRSIKRVRRYAFLLVERSFCLDVNFLSSHGFFRGGRGTKWDYECRNIRDGYLGGAYIMLWDSEYRDEFAVEVESSSLYSKTTVRTAYERHPLVRWRYWFRCPKCKKRTATIFIPLGVFELACRKCHRLVYWSQMRGKRRLGVKEYKKQRELYKVNKELKLWKEDL
jgi:hypothetical protein